MKLSILPVFVAFVFIFCIAITRRARSNESIKAAEARSVYALLLSFFAWTLVAVVLGIKGTHFELMARVPLLWQPFTVEYRFHLLRYAPKRPAWHCHEYTGVLVGLYADSPHWSLGRNHERDPRRNHVRVRFLDRHTGLPLWRLRPRRRVAAVSKGCRPSILNSLEPCGLRADHPTHVRTHELLDERAGVHLHF